MEALRKLILVAAGACAFLLTTGCNDTANQAEVAAAPKKSMARQAPMYAGQSQLQSVQAGTIESAPGGGVVLKARATAAGDGWSQLSFLPRIYPATPPDGIYEVDVVGQQPTAPGAAAPKAVEVHGAWSKYTDGRVKGVKFITETNEVTAMLPAGGAETKP